jgi:hypothetical protein
MKKENDHVSPDGQVMGSTLTTSRAETVLHEGRTQGVGVIVKVVVAVAANAVGTNAMPESRRRADIVAFRARRIGSLWSD